jgi:hypothetical protein
VMIKKIWAVLLPCIIIISFALGISNLITTWHNHQMLLQIINSVR